MDPNDTAPDYAAEREAMCAAGLSDGLAEVIVYAFREHDAAGRPLIVLAPAGDTPCEHLSPTMPPAVTNRDEPGE